MSENIRRVMLLTFLTHPNFLVLFRTGKESQPSNRDSGKEKWKQTLKLAIIMLSFIFQSHARSQYIYICFFHNHVHLQHHSTSKHCIPNSWSSGTPPFKKEQSSSHKDVLLDISISKSIYYCKAMFAASHSFFICKGITSKYTCSPVTAPSEYLKTSHYHSKYAAV